jgi:transposase-like protein
MDVSLGRSELDAYLFLSKVKSKCKGKLPEIITDRGPWYNIVKRRNNPFGCGERIPLEGFYH